jgi:gamma-glutamylputrescine oxidase
VRPKLLPENHKSGHAMRDDRDPPSYYAESAGPAPSRAGLAGDRRADVAVIGAGFTGLSAAMTLAQRGFDVVVLEAETAGWGASGRNGGQIHTGQRRDPDWLAARLGDASARRLVEFAEEARLWQRSLIAEHGLDVDLTDGLIHGVHKRRLVEGERREAAQLRDRWGFDLSWLTAGETAAALGTDAYFGGVRDARGGHLHPMKLALGLARLAEAAGATIYEHSRVTAIHHGAKVRLETAGGSVTADTVVLAGNGYLGGLDPETDARVMPLNNYVLATEPLGERLIPGGEAASDTRFVVYYWRQTGDGRLIFGGGETYSPRFPKDIEGFVRGHLRRIYPRLADAPVSHAWGGTLAITVNRLPYVRRPRPNVWVAAGYSGQGVVLAPYAGRILGEAIAGQMERFDAFAAMPCPPFPGGRLMRWPTLVAAMSWFALRDRL